MTYGDLTLSVYVDADSGNKDNDRRSVSVGSTVVNANSSTQHYVTRSTSEADHVATAQGAKTALFTEAVLDFLQPGPVRQRIGLFERQPGDNHDGRKPHEQGVDKNHLGMPSHFKELVERRVLSVQFMESCSQHADIPKKPLGLKSFVKHRAFHTDLPDRCNYYALC